MGQSDFCNRTKENEFNSTPQAGAKDPKVKRVRFCKLSSSGGKAADPRAIIWVGPGVRSGSGSRWTAHHCLRAKWPPFTRKQVQKESLSPNLDSSSSPMTYDTCPVPALDHTNFLGLRPRVVTDAGLFSDPTSS